MSDFISAGPPASGDRIDWAENKGALMVIEPHSLEVGVSTSNGLSDAIRADVHVITGPGTATDYNDVLVFPKILQSQLRNQLGLKVVGRLNQGAAQTGKSAPWILDAANEDDIAKAKEWAASNNAPVAAAPPF
jgi:hypothetical protein